MGVGGLCLGQQLWPTASEPQRRGREKGRGQSPRGLLPPDKVSQAEGFVPPARRGHFVWKTPWEAILKQTPKTVGSGLIPRGSLWGSSGSQSSPGGAALRGIRVAGQSEENPALSGGGGREDPRQCGGGSARKDMTPWVRGSEAVTRGSRIFLKGGD